jgi:DNA-binding response OmpR family regulator
MSPAKRRILCVEDNAEDCELLKTYLELEDYEVVFAHTMADGFHKAKSERFNLYLIDERLPDGLGSTLTRQIRVFDSKTPLIFYSASAYESDIQRGLDAGAQVYITKPSDPNQVIEVIKTLIA